MGDKIVRRCEHIFSALENRLRRDECDALHNSIMHWCYECYIYCRRTAYSMNASVSGAENSSEMGTSRYTKNFFFWNAYFLNTMISFLNFYKAIQIKIAFAFDTLSLGDRIRLFSFWIGSTKLLRVEQWTFLKKSYFFGQFRKSKCKILCIR